VPLSVAVVDMDWHLVDIDPKYGSGWTGYTWDRALFPDPPAFLQWLHRHGLHVTLNVHPADGGRAFEDAYRPMAEALGLDASREETIRFEPAERRFLRAYLDVLHHPLEELGVDFW
jgi:alpha-glucosidase (family GH31 glycosyl hydrolase)